MINPATTLRLPVTSSEVKRAIIAPFERPEATGHGEAGPASKRVVAGFGFWVFLISDIVMFSAFFATYAVLCGNTAGGPSAGQLFDLNNSGHISHRHLLNEVTHLIPFLYGALEADPLRVVSYAK